MLLMIMLQGPLAAQVGIFLFLQQRQGLQQTTLRGCHRAAGRAELKLNGKKPILIFCFCNILTFNFYFS